MFIDTLDIVGLLRLVYIANILDAVLTLCWVNMQVADEANPLMAYLIDIDTTLFLLVKISFVTLSCVILWVFRAHHMAKLIAFLAAILYLCIIIYHIVGAYQAGVVTIPTFASLNSELLHAGEVFYEYLGQVVDKVRG